MPCHADCRPAPEGWPLMGPVARTVVAPLKTLLNSLPRPTSPANSPRTRQIAELVLKERFDAMRRGMRSAVPVNALLSVLVALVAWRSGHGVAVAGWLALSLAVSAVRLWLCASHVAPWWESRGSGTAGEGGGAGAADVRPLAPGASELRLKRHLRHATGAAIAAGCCWALVPLFTDSFASAEAVFYLMVVCGLCAGSVTYGSAYAPVPLGMMTPALLSFAGALVVAGGPVHLALSASVVLYLVTLMRSALEGQRHFVAASQLKNEATITAAQLERAQRVSAVASQELAFRVSHDALTGLYNREGFSEAACLRMVAAPAPARWAVLLLNLDGFKRVNDMLGASAADRLLRDVALSLEQAFESAQATLGRWGGDEFAMMVPQCDEVGPASLAHRMLAVANAAGGVGWQPGAGIGVGFAEHASFVELMRHADEALRAAKRSGRNQVRLFDEALGRQLAMREDVERDLGEALASSAIQVWYQPIVRAHDGTPHSLEALMRWTHPSHGRIAPEEVIAAAARSGRAEALLGHLIGEVFQAMAALDRARPLLAGLPIAINVSPREMSQLAVDRIVLDMLAAHGVPAQRLQLEITEEVALDIDAAMPRLMALARAGVRIVVDDYGVGYSSLNALRGDHVRQVKIDRSFVKGLDDCDISRALVESVVRLGRTIDVEVVAEGVETAGELATLKQLGCELVQGYFLGMPAPMGELVPRLRCPGRPDDPLPGD